MNQIKLAEKKLVGRQITRDAFNVILQEVLKANKKPDWLVSAVSSTQKTIAEHIKTVEQQKTEAERGRVAQQQTTKEKAYADLLKSLRIKTQITKSTKKSRKKLFKDIDILLTAIDRSDFDLEQKRDKLTEIKGKLADLDKTTSKALARDIKELLKAYDIADLPDIKPKPSKEPSKEPSEPEKTVDTIAMQYNEYHDKLEALKKQFKGKSKKKLFKKLDRLLSLERARSEDRFLASHQQWEAGNAEEKATCLQTERDCLMKQTDWLTQIETLMNDVDKSNYPKTVNHIQAELDKVIVKDVLSKKKQSEEIDSADQQAEYDLLKNLLADPTFKHSVKKSRYRGFTTTDKKKLFEDVFAIVEAMEDKKEVDLKQKVDTLSEIKTLLENVGDKNYKTVARQMKSKLEYFRELTASPTPQPPPLGPPSQTFEDMSQSPSKRKPPHKRKKAVLPSLTREQKQEGADSVPPKTDELSEKGKKQKRNKQKRKN